MHLTLYSGANGAKPISQDDFDDWPEVVESLSDLVHRESDAEPGASREEQKLGLLAVAPHRLTKPLRKLKHVSEVTMLFLDVDACDLWALAQRVDDLGIDAVIYTSPSDDPDGPPDQRRCRVVAPVSRPIAVSECWQSRFAFAEMLGLAPDCGVAQAKDAARLFFCGRLHDTPEREFLVFGSRAGTDA